MFHSCLTHFPWLSCVLSSLLPEPASPPPWGLPTLVPYRGPLSTFHSFLTLPNSCKRPSHMTWDHRDCPIPRLTCQTPASTKSATITGVSISVSICISSSRRDLYECRKRALSAENAFFFADRYMTGPPECFLLFPVSARNTCPSLLVPISGPLIGSWFCPLSLSVLTSSLWASDLGHFCL